MKIILDLFKFTLMGLVKTYAYGLSPIFPRACRFHPTCSSYAYEALRLHGGGKGLILMIKRIGSCHPWGKYGIDPVPEQKRVKK